MKANKLALSLLWGCMALADHSSPMGSVARLLAEAEDLNQFALSSTLRYNVKDAVFRFNASVEDLANCVRFGPRPVLHDHTEDVGIPGACNVQLSITQGRFRLVSRYLWDTQFDYPQLYGIYREVAESLEVIRPVGPIDPGPVRITCIAVDRGWEEHFGGHRGIGRTLADAQRMALLECQRLHGSCVIQRCDRS